MGKLKIGLAPNRVSFYDKHTNTLITLDNPIKEIEYDDNTNLIGICHAVNCKYPVLRLYEGKFPEKVLEEWKKKYQFKAKGAIKRADKNQEKSGENSPETPQEPETPEEPEVPEENPETPGDSDEEGEVGASAVKEKKETKKRKTTKKKSTTKKKEEKKEDK